MSWDTSDRRERLPDDWPAIRATVLERDKGVCYECGRPGADSVDHKERGDDHSMANLAAMHMNVWPYCHRRKSSSEGGIARAARRRRPTEPHPGVIRHG